MIGSCLEILKRESFTFILNSHFGMLFQNMQNLGKHFFKRALSFWTLLVGEGGGVRLDALWQRSLTVFFLTLEEHSAYQVPP